MVWNRGNFPEAAPGKTFSTSARDTVASEPCIYRLAISPVLFSNPGNEQRTPKNNLAAWGYWIGLL